MTNGCHEGLERYKIVEICGLTGSYNFVCKRKKFVFNTFLNCRAMLCIARLLPACGVCRLSVTFVSCAKTNKDILEIFSPSGSQANLSGASIPGGLGEQSPTFFKVEGVEGLVISTNLWRLDRQPVTRKAAISHISESTYAKVTYFYRLLLVVTLGIQVMPRVNRDLKLYYKCVCFCKQHKSIHSSVQIAEVLTSDF